MVLYKGGHGADLDSVGVVGRVLEQAVVRVEELLGEQEEELSRRAAVVQAEGRGTTRDMEKGVHSEYSHIKICAYCV